MRLSIGHAVAAAYAIVILALVGHLGAYLAYALRAVRYPFQLDYGEGIIWQQALMIPSQQMYGDITRPPFIVFHYPPLYHLVVRGIALVSGDMLETGRAVSLFCTLLTGGLVAALAHDAIGPGAGRPARLTGAAIAGLTVFCYYPLIFWSPYMRVDMLATALSVLGLFLFARSLRHPALLYASVLAFVLAVYTKQSSVAAPLSVLAVALVVDRRRALLAFGLAFVVGLALLLLLLGVTDGGFFRHLLLYNLNRFSLAVAASAAYRNITPHAIFLIMAIGGIATAWREIAAQSDAGRSVPYWSRLRRTPSAQLIAALTLYLIFSAVMLVGLGKSGAAKNYFIEFMCGWSVMIGVLVASALERDRNAPPAVGVRRIISPMLVPAALLVQVLILPASRNFGGDDARMNRELDGLVTSIREAPKPVLSDDMVLLLKAGQQVPWEPAIFAELASMGRWDQQPIVDTIAHRDWAFIITEGNPGDLIYDSRFTPPVDQAIRRYYPRTESRGDRTVHFPPR